MLSNTITDSHFQICANLDSTIVSTKNYVAELKKNVPKPRKTFDIVEKRPAVSQIVCLYQVDGLKLVKRCCQL